jgi:nucleoside-diphosphate-sugar epimerase
MDINRNSNKRVLVVGAGGFAGGFIVEEGLRRGFEVWAGVRNTTSRQWLTDSRIKFIELDFDNPNTFPVAMNNALGDGERWDYIVYNLGATKCLRFSDFNRINYEYLRHFTEALHKCSKEPDRLLYMSSLSVMGPGDERGYTPFKSTDIPHPNTKYGASKLKAEMWLLTSGINTIVFRCTGLYGPRDHDYFLMFDAIAKGFDFSVGYRKQQLTFLYIEDLAKGIYDALKDGRIGKTYLMAEGKTYTQKEFRKISAEIMGKRFVIGVKMPLWCVKVVSAIAEKIGVLRMKPSTLNRDKYHIMKQRNWAVDISDAQQDFGFKGTTDLREGVRKSIEWYRKEGWLK